MENSDVMENLLPSSEKDEDEERLSRRLLVENKKLWVVAGPAILTRFSTFGVGVITQAFIGHVGSTELAAYALISTVLSRFANGILLGMASALETLCGQAYGARQHHMLGIYLQRSWIVLIACAFLLFPLFIFATPILRLLGQEESIARVAGTVALWFLPIIFSYVFSFTFQMFLQAQSKNMIISYLAVLSLSLHVFLFWLTVVKFSMGVAGAMSLMILALWIPVLGQFAFVIGGGCPETWKGFSSSAFSDLLPVIRLSLSSGAMICLEIWYNSILLLLTGHIKNAEVAIDALSICLNINGWEMMIALGFLAAAGARVANELGAGSAKAAKFSIVVVTTQSVVIGLTLFVVFLLVRGNLAYIFTNNPEVVRAVGDLSPLLAFSILLNSVQPVLSGELSRPLKPTYVAVGDLSPLLAFSILLNSVQPVLSGVAVGAGWQSIVAYVNIACYYLIGIPLGVVLGYIIGFQVKGIWIGMILGTAAQTIALICITWRTNWDKQVGIAQARVNRWAVPTSDGQNNGNEVA